MKEKFKFFYDEKACEIARLEKIKLFSYAVIRLPYLVAEGLHL